LFHRINKRNLTPATATAVSSASSASPTQTREVHFVDKHGEFAAAQKPEKRTNTPLTPVKAEYASNGEFTEDQLYEHLLAYEKARYYHATLDRNAESILRSGLKRDHGGQEDGASGIADKSSQQSNQGKIFLGGDRATSLYYERQIRSDPSATLETLRIFLPPEQDPDLPRDLADNDNEAFWTSEFDVPPEHILRGRVSEAPLEAMQSVFEVVRRWHPNPESVTTEEVIKRHKEAIKRGLTVHAWRPGSNGRDRFIRDVRDPQQGINSINEGYESD